ncbi:MAG TPA: SpoIIE family protein phosphatase [Polyangiaceae bacterium]|nr:SpoIIE family protein phosphatase [Polyangiaceae bacterium]
MTFETAHLSFPKLGERVNGDAVLVRRDPTLQRTLLAVIDGLGHGPGAAEASERAVKELESSSSSASALELMTAVHHALRGTRGAVGTICLIERDRLEACAVGNVSLMCSNCYVPLVLSPGILGQSVSKFRIASAQLASGARLALLSDGLSLRFKLDELRELAPREVCKSIVDRFRRYDDDATVLVAELKSS